MSAVINASQQLAKTESTKQERTVGDKRSVKFANEESMMPGDRIEFCFEGSWLQGNLKSMDGETVSVTLDIDKEAGFVTKGPISMVRQASKKESTMPSHAVGTPASVANEQASAGEEQMDGQPVKFMSAGDRVEIF